MWYERVMLTSDEDDVCYEGDEDDVWYERVRLTSDED